MHDTALFDLFMRFALTAALGFLIGLERGKAASDNAHMGTRDFILFGLIGATSALIAQVTGSDWVMALGFIGFLAMLVSGYWADRQEAIEQGWEHENPGITTELAAILMFFVGILVVFGQAIPAIALSILALAVLSHKQTISTLRAGIQDYEFSATLKFLVISFIILPVLPRQSADTFITADLGTLTAVESVAEGQERLVLDLATDLSFSAGEAVKLHNSAGPIDGMLTVSAVDPVRLEGVYSGAARFEEGQPLRMQLNIPVVSTMLEAIRPYKVWLIVVLVSFISYIGYILVKVIGPRAGIGLTGIIGGLASSTVTTLSFAKRSTEAPAWNQSFAVAVILASSVMFPRLLLEIFVVNTQLTRNMIVPMMAMGVTGMVMAALYHFRAREEVGEGAELRLENPFSLKSAVTFGLLFAAILMLTRLAITYLGDAWLPVVALVSGLTDADAIAFSISDAQHAGLISLDWASFNVVLGALSNTFMKLFLVLTLGHRGLFKRLLLAFIVIGTVGIVTMLLYYDLSSF